jgi:hypothetical protein
VMAAGAEISLALALDSRDQGGVERVAFAPVSPFAKAPQLSLRSRRNFHVCPNLGRSGHCLPATLPFQMAVHNGTAVMQLSLL